MFSSPARQPSYTNNPQAPLPPSHSLSGYEVRPSGESHISRRSTSQRSEILQVANYDDLKRIIAETRKDIVLGSAYDEVTRALNEYFNGIGSQKWGSGQLLNLHYQANSFLERLSKTTGNFKLMSLVSTLAKSCGEAAFTLQARNHGSGHLIRRAVILKSVHEKIEDFKVSKSTEDWLTAILLIKAYVSETMMVIPEARATETIVPDATGPDMHAPSREVASEPHLYHQQMIPLHDEVIGHISPRRSSRDSRRRYGPEAPDNETNPDRNTQVDAMPDIRSTRSEAGTLHAMSREEQEKADGLMNRINLLMEKIHEGHARTFSPSGLVASIKLSNAFKDVKELLDTYSPGHTADTKQALREYLLNGLSTSEILNSLGNVNNDLKAKYARLFQRIMNPRSLENGTHRQLRNKPYASVVVGLAGNDHQAIDALRLISQETATEILDRIRPHRINGGSLFFQDRIFAGIESHWGENSKTS